MKTKNILCGRKTTQKVKNENLSFSKSLFNKKHTTNKTNNKNNQILNYKKQTKKNNCA